MRTAVMLITLLLALPTHAADAPDGAKVYAQRCAACHRDVPKLMASVKQKVAADQREAWLKTFVAKHHAPAAPADRDALIAYLAKLAAS